MPASRDIFRRYGFIGALLVMLFVVAQPAWAAPCEPTPAVASIEQASPASTNVDPCADDCEDCALFCSHGCCHPHAAALIGTAFPPAPAVRFALSEGWSNAVPAPQGRVAGPDRPPRA